MTAWHLLTAVVAQAPRYDGEDPGEPLGTLTALAIFVGIPLAVTLIVSLLVLAPGWTRTARSGGNTDWSGDPLWLGSADQGQAVSAAGPAAITSGSASASGTGSAAGTAALDQRGGASGRW